MRYEFIKIVDTQDGQMAYMLDHERGVIVVAPVEYLGETAPTRTVRRVEYVEDERPPVRRRVAAPVEEIREDAPPVRRPAVGKEDNGLPVLKGPVAGEGVDAHGLHDIGSSRPQKPQSIMPPHLRGILKKDGAIESRETIG